MFQYFLTKLIMSLKKLYDISDFTKEICTSFFFFILYICIFFEIKTSTSILNFSRNESPGLVIHLDIFVLLNIDF